MMTKHILTSCAFIGTLLLATTGLQATPISGLTVAVSPDGQQLVAAGSNRTFLQLNPETLEVTGRVWNGLSITKMAFNREGTVLAVTDAGMGGLVTLFDAGTLQRKMEVKSCDVASFSTKADLFAGIDGNRREPTVLNVYGISDGTQKAKINLVPKRPVVAVGLDLEGEVAAVIYEGQNDTAEEKASPDSSLKGFERTVAQQKADGRTSLVEFYEIASGKKLAAHTIFYVSSGVARAIVLDGKLVVVNYQNQNAVIGQDGSVTMFDCANSFNYGIGFSDDYAFVLTGGLANLSLTSTKDWSSKGFNVMQRLPSWPEYFKGFAANGAGRLFGATDGYRVFLLNENGSVKLEKPAF